MHNTKLGSQTVDILSTVAFQRFQVQTILVQGVQNRFFTAEAGLPL